MLQTFLGNSCFVLLFCTMLCYWCETFFMSSWDGTSFLSQSPLKKIANLGMVFANVCLLFLLFFRWKETEFYPLSNIYESLVFLAWTITLVDLFLEFIYKIPLIGTIVSPLAFFTIAFADFSLPKELQNSTTLVPALKSNWILMHVTIILFSYTTLLIGCLFSINYLILTLPLTVDTYPFNYISPKTGNQWADTLDNWSYRTLGVGFVFLTFGIFSGAVWANEAWGSYWSWDPKETWAFITWIVFAIYLHTRLTKGWSGKKSAWLASFGFIIVWICFLGVNLFGKGLHSYGWFSIN